MEKIFNEPMNQKSALNLVREQGGLDVFESKNKAGKFFFRAGVINGYASSKAAAVFNDTSRPKLERLADLQYAEVSRLDSPDVIVPCLMVVNHSENFISVADVAKV